MIEVLLAGVFGLLIGSFLNVCIYRLPLDLSVVRPRSFCPACNAQIAWYDNIPVLSYALLLGQCRRCQARISARYPAVELVTGVVFSAAVALNGPTLGALKACVFGALLIALTITDLETRILPDELTYGGMLAGLGFAWGGVLDAIIAAVVSAGAMWLVAWIYKKLRHRDGLGFGDVKLIAMIGVFLGMQGVLLTILAGSLVGAVISIVYLLAMRKDAGSYELPFGTFLGAAALAVSLFGRPLMDWYDAFLR